MSSSNKKRPPRIAFAFATLLVAAIFYAGAYLYTKIAQPTAPSVTSASAQATKETTAQADETARKQSEANKKRAEEEAKKEAEKKAAEKKAAEEEQKKKAATKPRQIRHKLEGTSASKVEKSNVYGALTQAIGTFEDKDYTVAFALYDINTGVTLTYNGKEELYPASSIKAPFTTSIYQELVDKGEVSLDEVAPVAQETIVESSDEGYRALHEAYGEQAFITWLKDAGVEPGSYGSYEETVGWNYPHICAEQFSLMWRGIYTYLNTKTEAAKQLGKFLETRTVSSLRKALDKNTRSQSKMGWFEIESDYNSMPATVEGGVVYSKQGPYIIIVMTSAPALLDEMVPLEQAITSTHVAML